MAVSNYQQLLVWQNGMELVRRVYRLTNSFPAREAYGLTSQIQRAVVSIPANIAEGHTRGSTREFLRFVTISHGSLAELETLLLVAQDLNYMTPQSITEIQRISDATSRMLSSLRRKLKAKSLNP